MHMI